MGDWVKKIKEKTKIPFPLELPIYPHNTTEEKYIAEKGLFDRGKN